MTAREKGRKGEETFSAISAHAWNATGMYVVGWLVRLESFRIVRESKSKNLKVDD